MEHEEVFVVATTIKSLALSSDTSLHYLVSLEAEYRRYIEGATGTAPAFEAVAGERFGKLPLYLRGYYRIAKTRLFGHPRLLAFQTSDADTATPTEYARHHGTLRATLGDEVVLVLPRIASYGRQQLVRMGVPFVVPHRQIFLPTLLVGSLDGGLTAAAQVVLLCHLLRKSVEGVSLRDLARELGYSAMTLSTVRSELEFLKLCKPIRKGRSTHLVFSTSGHALWERAEPHLRNPVKVRHWVREMRADESILQAGLTALAASSMISDNELPTYAMKISDYRARLGKGILDDCFGPEGAQACVECWNYDPRLLSDGPTVDRLSLYLSLHGTDDERVAKALKTLVEDPSW